MSPSPSSIHEDASGGSSPNDEGEWTVFNPEELGVGGTYGLGISAVAPRPIGVITSHNKEGIINCAPYS